VLKLGEFDLELTLECTCPQRKYIEDQPGPVYNPSLQRLFQISFLCRSQGMIDQDNIRISPIRQRFYLV